MKMPALLKRDVTAALEKTRDDLTAATSRLVTLEADRGAALLVDDIGPLLAADQKIEQAKRAIAAHREQFVALETRRRREQADELQRQRTAAVADCEKRYAAKIEAAVELERAFSHVADAWARYEQAASAVWTPALAELFPNTAGLTRADNTAVTISKALGLGDRWAAHRLRECAALVGPLAAPVTAYAATVVGALNATRPEIERSAA